MGKESGPWPRFLAPAREALEKVRPPEGAFNPLGPWEHAYTVSLLGPERMEKGEHPQSYGTMLLKRKPVEGGRFNLDVDLSIFTRGRSGMRTRATVTCAADPLATPLQWELRSDIVDQSGVTPGTSITETATVRDGMVVRTGKTTRKASVPRPYTSNWSLLEAVQRLPFEAQSPLAFGMFEDLDMYKPGQSLRAIGTVSLDLGGKTVRLHGFRQTGRGILPTHYWLDDAHRLIVSTGSLRAIIWDKGNR